MLPALVARHHRSRYRPARVRGSGVRFHQHPTQDMAEWRYQGWWNFANVAAWPSTLLHGGHLKCRMLKNYRILSKITKKWCNKIKSMHLIHLPGKPKTKQTMCPQQNARNTNKTVTLWDQLCGKHYIFEQITQLEKYSHVFAIII